MKAQPIAFYAPLKSAEHAVPSGDRLMARSLIRCMQEYGYVVETASQLRARIRDPHDQPTNTQLLADAAQEVERLTQLWNEQGAPVCWFCYHPYYKSPDLIGPPLCKAFGIPYVTAEASYSQRRTEGFWGEAQNKVLEAVNDAAVNVYFTERDKLGLREGSPTANLVRLKPFITPVVDAPLQTISDKLNLVAVAMMRPGDKFDSYVALAEALALIEHIPWVLNVVGDGPMKAQIHALFEKLPPEKIIWHGALSPMHVASVYAAGAVYVWPGCGEAYGLAYLEAQSAGLPVVAFNTAGVPEVVKHERTGILVEDDNVSALANSIARLLTNTDERHRMARNALRHVHDDHTSKQASVTLGKILQRAIGTVL